MPISAHTARGALAAAFATLLALIGGACKAPPPACPRGDLCVEHQAVLGLGQTGEQVLGCPMYVAWSPEVQAPSSFATVAAKGEGQVDLEATRKSRASGTSDLCCYHAYQLCPAPPAGTSRP